MSTIIVSWLGWRFIPDLVSNHLLKYFHRFYGSVLGRPVPPSNHPLYHKHRRYLYAFVVFCWAVYTFEKTAMSIGKNYYELLGVPPTANESALKAGFRAFAKKYHPDRAGPEAEVLFMEVRDAYEALKNPITRFAYDRFGSAALKWSNCTTMQDYISHGLYESMAMYLVSICALVFWNKMAPRDLAFWNYILLAGSLAYELLFILSPSPSDPSKTTLSSLVFSDPVTPSNSGWFGFFWPSRVAYQHIHFLRALSLLISSALYQVLPNIFPTNPETLDPRQLSMFFNGVNALTRNLDTELYTSINADLHSCNGTENVGHFPTKPCQPSESVMALIDKEIENMILESSLHASGGPIQSLIDQVNRKRKKQRELNSAAGDSSAPPALSRRDTGMASAPGQSLEGYLRGRSRSWDR